MIIQSLSIIKNRVSVRCLCVVYSLLVILGVTGIAKASSHFTFELHSQAKVFVQSEQVVDDYVVALDVYKKTDNRWRPDTFERKKGLLNTFTLELPRDYSEKEVFHFYRQQLPENAVELFACKARSCGESNNWANDHFSIKQLYGTNASQHYVVFRVPISASLNTESYVTIYTVRRGNRRLYTQLDVLSITP